METIETTLASTAPTELLNPDQMVEFQESVTINVYTFKDLSLDQRQEMFFRVSDGKPTKLSLLWNQFKNVCGDMVKTSYIQSFKNSAINGVNGKHAVDKVIILSIKKYVLAYAMVMVKEIKYDDITLTRLKKMRDPDWENKTLQVKLLCARDGSGMGSCIMRVCESIGIQLKCASLHLEAVPTAFGFYKNNGFVPFAETRFACIEKNEKYKSTDLDKFTKAIQELQEKLQKLTTQGKGKKKGIPTKQEIDDWYKTIFNYVEPAAGVVLDGVAYSRIEKDMKSWFYGLEPKQVEPLLKEIVDTVFTENNDYSEEIPMTKCLLEKIQSADGEWRVDSSSRDRSGGGASDTARSGSDSDSAPSSDDSECVFIGGGSGSGGGAAGPGWPGITGTDIRGGGGGGGGGGPGGAGDRDTGFDGSGSSPPHESSDDSDCRVIEPVLEDSDGDAIVHY